MAPNSIHLHPPNGLIRIQVQSIQIINLRLLYLISILILPIVSKSQDTSTGFKPSTNSNVDKTGSGGSNEDKLVDFITGNPHQRSLPNNSQSQSYADLFTRGLGHFLGGGTGTSFNSQPGQQGYYPPNYGPFGLGGVQQHLQPHPQFGIGGGGNNINKGLPFPPGPYPFPGQFPGQFGPGGVRKQPFPQQQYPFNPPLGPPVPGGYFQQGFPGIQGYPYPGNGGGGVGNLFFGAPKQVRVPGRIDIELRSNDAIITCEFPRFLILIQKVYWHHKYDDPYGTYYDTTNRFGPRVTVTTPDKWRSVLYITNYNEDDFGTYRCLTAAILPDEGANNQYGDNRNQYLLRSPSTTTEVSAIPPSLRQQEYVVPSSRLKLPEKSKPRNGKDMKFPPSSSSNRVTRKIRFSRSAKAISNPPGGLDTPSAASRQHNYNRIDEKDDTFTLNLNNNNNPGSGEIGGINPTKDDLTKQGSEEVYDPYFFQSNQDPEGPTARNYYLDQNSLHHPGSPFSTSTLPPIGGGIPPHDSRYNPLANAGGYGGYPNFPPQGAPGYGPYAPYYKPSYGVFTVYQEIKFTHPINRFGGGGGGLGGHGRNTSPRSQSHKL